MLRISYDGDDFLTCLRMLTLKSDGIFPTISFILGLVKKLELCHNNLMVASLKKCVRLALFGAGPKTFFSVLLAAMVDLGISIP